MGEEKDLVERLRECFSDDYAWCIEQETLKLIGEAADEIERLREQIWHLMAIRDAQASVLGQGVGSLKDKIMQVHDKTMEMLKD